MIVTSNSMNQSSSRGWSTGWSNQRLCSSFLSQEKLLSLELRLKLCMTLFTNLLAKLVMAITYTGIPSQVREETYTAFENIYPVLTEFRKSQQWYIHAYTSCSPFYSRSTLPILMWDVFSVQMLVHFGANILESDLYIKMMSGTCTELYPRFCLAWVVKQHVPFWNSKA